MRQTLRYESHPNDVIEEDVQAKATLNDDGEIEIILEDDLVFLGRHRLSGLRAAQAFARAINGAVERLTQLMTRGQNGRQEAGGTREIRAGDGLPGRGGDSDESLGRPRVDPG